MGDYRVIDPPKTSPARINTIPPAASRHAPRRQGRDHAPCRYADTLFLPIDYKAVRDLLPVPTAATWSAWSATDLPPAAANPRPSCEAARRPGLTRSACLSGRRPHRNGDGGSPGSGPPVPIPGNEGRAACPRKTRSFRQRFCRHGPTPDPADNPPAALQANPAARNLPARRL